MADDAAAQAGGADAPRDRAELYARALGRPALPPQQQQRAGDPVSVEFQAVSWHADDVGGGGDDSDSSDDSDDGRRGGGGGGGAGGDGAAYVVKAFGVDERGASVGLTVRGFTPFFYVRLAGADAPFWKEAAAELTRAHGRRNGLLEARPFAKKDFWGFSHGRVDTFLRLSFRTQRGMRFAAAALRKEPAVRAAGREVQLRLYESNIDPLLRLFHCADLEPAGWVRAARARPASGALRSCCQVDLECDWKDLRPARRDEMAPLLIAAFDIECNSAHGDFPCAIKDYRRLAVDLQELWERGGAKGLSGYDARLVVADAMREAFGLPPADAARVAAAPAAKLAPGAGRVARLQLKRAATARDLELIGALVLTRVDDVIACLKGGDAGGAGAAAVAAAEGGAGGAAEDDDEGGGGADEAAAAANPALARLLALLNATFGRRWPLRGDEVIQVGMTLNVYGQRECCARYVLALGGCEPVPGAHTLSFADEGQLLLAWVGLVRALDPDVVTGYNINGFDMAYLYDRAKELFGGEASPGVVERFCRLGRLEGVPSRFEEQRLASSALGDNTLRYIDMHGRVLVDLMKVVQRDHKLDSYKLDAVAQHFTGQAKHDVSPQDIFRLQRGSDADRRVIAEYCVQDCALCNLLVAKLETMANNVGMANVCSVPLSFIFMRGQGVKIFSLVAKQCRKDGFLIPARARPPMGGGGEGEGEEEAGYEGAIVLEPQEGLYLEEPVSVLDYASLYPSSMISENLSHDSLVLDPAYDNLPGVEYVTVKFDAHGPTGERLGEVACRFAQVGTDGRTPGKAVLPRILQGLLAQRKATRRRMEHVRLPGGEAGALDAARLEFAPADGSPRRAVTAEEAAAAEPAYNAFQLAVLDGLQQAYKVTANSLYGQMGSRTSPLYLKQVAACTTAVGRAMILKAKAFMEAEHGARVVYGDSVAPGTPVLARLADGRIAVAPVEALAAPGAAWREWRGGKEQTTDLIATEVWAAGAWAALLRLVRHRAGKPVVRVATAGGVADVTEDHSLVLEGGGALAKPSALRPGATRLQHVRPPQAALAPVAAGAPSGEALPGAASLPLLGWLNNPDAAAREGVLDAIFPGSGTCAFSSQTDAQAAYVLAASVGRTAEVLGARSLRLLPRGADPPPPPSPVVASCTPLPPAAADPAGEEAYVYDLETSSGVFQGGVGCLLLKNTDSIFCVFPNLDPATGARLRGRDALVASIATGQEASRRFRPLLKPPHDLEYEKTFFPFVLLSKKRYVGLLYEADPDKCKQKSMGIVLKRRDNAQIVKRVYGGVIDILLQQRDVPESARFVERTLRDLIEGRVDMADLVISKTLRSFYKDPTRIAHNVLAQRIGERDPGSKPQSNDRIPYVYVVPPPALARQHAAMLLQGDRIETPEYVRQHGLTPDYRHYITNQVMKPVLQIYALPGVLEQLPAYRADARLSGPRALADAVAAAGGDARKGRDKLAALREREVERLLFAPALAHPRLGAARLTAGDRAHHASLLSNLRNKENAKNRQHQITSFFGNKAAPPSSAGAGG